MSKTVSFVARDELADWLESKADKEMKTISSLCQDIIASEYRRQTQENPDKSGNTEGGGEKSGVDDSSQEDDKSPLEQPPFSENTQAWYRPNVQDDDVVVAVRNPVDHTEETRRYYKTYDGAAKAIRRWWE
jgi:hypothetical protein